MTIQLYSLAFQLNWGGLSVLPKAELQRAADLLLGANARNSQILRERATFLVTLYEVETVQNVAHFDSRDEYTPPFLDYLLPAYPGPS